MGTLVAKIKSAPILMATISITFLGAVISFIITLVMAEWALGYLEMRVPFDVEIRNNYSHSFISEANISNANELPALDYSEVVDYLNEKGYDVNNYCEVKKYFINEEEYYNIDQKNISMIGIRLSDFNKMRRMLGYEEISLKDQVYFIIPIAIAIIGVIIFIYNFYIIYKNIINTYIGNEVFILTIILGVILMIGIYLCYFVGTYYSFKRNINN